MLYPYKVDVTVTYSDSSVKVYEDFGKKEDNGKWIFTAKRILKEQANLSPRFIKSKKGIDFIPINTISDEYKEGWPIGLKTIPLYHFTYEQKD